MAITTTTATTTKNPLNELNDPWEEPIAPVELSLGGVCVELGTYADTFEVVLDNGTSNSQVEVARILTTLIKVVRDIASGTAAELLGFCSWKKN